MSIFKETDILIPRKGIDLEKWSVIACDQHTSEPEYWEKVKKTAEGAPSTASLIFPEVYLPADGKAIEKINVEMEKYLKDGVFTEYPSAMIYLERTQADGRVRRGLVGAVDLEEYDFSANSRSKIRATEKTVAERIPPRVEIRENAPLELPHIMILINDEADTVIKPSEGDTLYDFDLMEGGGHLRGVLMTPKERENAVRALDLLEKNAADGPVYAVGDGNHSLATAKTCWEKLKPTIAESERLTHPARFCMVELVNIHDGALDFEPIHRLVFDCGREVADGFLHCCGEASYKDNGGQKIEYIANGVSGNIYVKDSGLVVAMLQKYLDANNLRTDYIHGADTVKRLAGENNVGFILPAIDKNGLFLSVAKDGSLPRKTFSMGNAEDKRYYMEARKIKL